jgi:hypothetical protein
MFLNVTILKTTLLYFHSNCCCRPSPAPTAKGSGLIESKVRQQTTDYRFKDIHRAHRGLRAVIPSFYDSGEIGPFKVTLAEESLHKYKL